LRPAGLDELGLAAALEHCVDTWRPRLPEVRLDLSLVGELDDLTEAVQLTVYRILQEGLNNVAKHARARRVVMEVARTRELVTVNVADDGVGMDIGAATQGLGLLGMRERVAALAGQLEVISDPGDGFDLRVRIPVDVQVPGV
jgi:two-component system, NarL family, sensor histidine kinase UhpB